MGIAIVLVGLAVAVAATPRRSQAAEVSGPPRPGAVTTLPAPFNQWDVQLGPRSGEDGALTLVYTSPSLGRSTENTVYLPSSYSSDGPPSPVLYFLHGAVAPPLDNPALHPVTSQEFALDMTASAGGDIQTRLQEFPRQRERAHFVVVAPDTARTGNWCQTCLWINGIKPTIQGQPPLSARTVPAETVLNSEVRPLVEHLFNVRTDRAGRGISGFSMGGFGALLQILRHPDHYAYVASISGPINFVDDPFWRTCVDLVGHTRDQGYGHSATDAHRWRTINPIDLIKNLAGTGTPVTITGGDGCIGPADHAGKRDCDRYPAARHPFAAQHRDADAPQQRHLRRRRRGQWCQRRPDPLPWRPRCQQPPGLRRRDRPRRQRGVRPPWPAAETFSYRTGDPLFSVWDYTVDTHRADFGVFTILDARRDGTAFAITGTGAVEMITPAAFEPGRSYSVTTSGTRALPARVVRADNQGRIRLDGLPLPRAGAAPGRITVAITPA